MEHFTIRDFAQVVFVAALYIVLAVTLPPNTVSHGAYQFCVSKTSMFMAFYSRRYIVGLTLGCMIADLYSFGLADTLVGGSQMFVSLTSGVILFDRYEEQYLFSGLFNKAFFYFSLLFSTSMFTTALELYYVDGSPFSMTRFTSAVGEFASLSIDAIIVDRLGKRIDLAV